MATKKITSNLAQYKNGQLTCIVCQVPVKNELYWTGHVNGRLHRDKILLLKRKAEPSASSSSSSGGQAKRSRLDDDEEPSSSKIKSTIPSKTTPGTQTEEQIVFKVPQDRRKAEAPVDREARLSNNGNLSYNNEINSSSSSSANNITESSSNQLVQESSQESGSSSKQTSKPKKEGIPNLPEGFYDDPKLDAKARGIEYVDPEDAEWDKFVKEIASEELQSESILVVDEEESRKERELDEIEDMMGHWQRVIDLEKKKESRVKRMEVSKDDESSSDEEDEFSEELDWRVKKLKKF